MGIALLLVGKSLEVLLYLESHDRRRGISQILCELFGLHRCEAADGSKTGDLRKGGGKRGGLNKSLWSPDSRSRSSGSGIVYRCP